MILLKIYIVVPPLPLFSVSVVQEEVGKRDK